MNMVIPDDGKELLLDWAVHDDGTGLEDFTLELFVNNETVDDASVLADFTLATFTGYSAVAIPRANMVNPTVVANVAQRSTTVAPVFTCTAGASETAYGWILVSNVTNTVVAGQNFDTPRVMSPGATETIDPFAIRLKTFT